MRFINLFGPTKKPKRQQIITFAHSPEIRVFNRSEESDQEELDDEGPSLIEQLAKGPTFLSLSPPMFDDIARAASCIDDEWVLQGIISNFDVNSQNGSGWTPLMYACQSGNYNCCKILLNNYAQLDIKNGQGQSALLLSVSWGHDHVVKLLLDYASSWHSNVLDLFDCDGFTPVHHAIFDNHLRCLKILLKHGASQDIRDKEGRVAIELAEEMRREEAIRELKKYRFSRPNNNVLIGHRKANY